MQVAMIPHAVVIVAMWREGRIFFRRRLLGTALARYVTDSTETAVWYICPTILRSASKPYKRAFPILTLSKNPARYRTMAIGAMCQSILRIRRASYSAS